MLRTRVMRIFGLKDRTPRAERSLADRPGTGAILRRLALDALAMLLAAVVGVVAFSAAAHGGMRLGPARISASLSPSLSPRTVVELPPFGTVEARTHHAPLNLVVRLTDLDLIATSRMVQSGELSWAKVLEAPVAQPLNVSGLSAMLTRIIGGGLLAAAVAALLVALSLRRRALVVVVAVIVAVAIPTAVGFVVYRSWDASAFRAPTLRGNLTYAPQVLEAFSTRVSNIRRLQSEAEKVAFNLSSYYADRRDLQSAGAFPNTMRVLHITDLHLDPVGAQLARSLAQSYRVSLVIDTGDLPILGAPIESTTYASLVDTSVPQVYVPGNHDSPESMAVLRKVGVDVVTSGTVTVDGLRIFGVADPIARDFGVEPDRARMKAEAQRALQGLRAALRSGEPTPDLVALHNPLMQRPFVGLVPLVLSGHSHAPSYRVTRGTALLNSGTIGGIGYEPGTVRRPLPYSASVLYYSASLPRRLLAIDRISVSPNRSTTITRELVDGSS